MSGHLQRRLYTFIYRSVPKPEQIKSLGGKIQYVSKYSPTVTASISRKHLLQLKYDPDLLYVEEDKTLSLPFHRVEKVVTSSAWIKGNQLVKKQVIPWNIYRVLGGNRLNSGAGIRVGVIDTGIDLTHPDLAANIKGGVNIVTPKKPPQDDNGHGTHVAGIIGALNNTIGVVGVAPQVSLYAIKVLNSSGSGSLTDLIQGIEWGIANRMHILNISISGGNIIPPALAQVVRAAVKRGIIIVAAAGNAGTASGKEDTVVVPARLEAVIAVAALNKDNRREPYSATGRSVNIAAPGTQILSAYSRRRYAVLSGTSMATAHVSGVLAIYRRAFPKESVTGLKRILEQRAIDLPPKGIDPLTGAGLVQAR